MRSHRHALPLIACVVVAVPAFGAGNLFDGTYTGERVLTKGDPAACGAKNTVSIVIHGDALTYINGRVKDYTLSFSPRADGSFGQLSDIGGNAVVIHGHVGAGVLDADVITAHCTHHWHAEKPH